MRNNALAALCMPLFAALAGCGTSVPSIEEPWEGTETYSRFSAGGLLEYRVKRKVYCGIVDAVLAGRASGLLPHGWAAQVSLSLQADEASAVSPGASFINPINPLRTSQSFTFGLGGSLSSQGTRESKFGSYWELDRLQSKSENPCGSEERQEQGSSLLLVNELGITEWFVDSLRSRNFLPSSEGTKGDPFYKQDFLSYRVKFVVISSGSATPTWKMVHLTSGNGGLPLVTANRTRTHELLLTFGPTFKAGSLNLAVNSHAAQELGIAVSNGARSLDRAFIIP
ncbi:MAG TPA: hypothetical protein VIT00_04190 [Terrimicrobiaceae bacterium]